MKNIFFFIVVLVCTNTMFGQSQEMVGTYQLDVKATNGSLKRTLILNSDGSFTFHNYENHDGGIPPEKNSYAKGTWTSKKKVVSFYITNSDLDDKHTLIFNNSKARFISKSPRDKSDRVIKIALRFFESEISWIKGMTIIKEE